MALFKTFHVHRLMLYGLLSAADLFLTWQLLTHGDRQAVETNPLANLWIATFGLTGLIVFKMMAVTAVVGSAVLIARHRPVLSGRILHFACLATAAVVLYSCVLAWAVIPTVNQTVRKTPIIGKIAYDWVYR